MREQGSSTFSTDEQLRVLDRLAGLEKIITNDMIRQALQSAGRVSVLIVGGKFGISSAVE